MEDISDKKGQDFAEDQKPEKEPLGEGSIKRPPADWHTAVNQPVFVIEESFFRSRRPPSLHWSIAWSDLMMTMFILFLTLFIYQLAHREFLDQENIEVVAGSTVALPPVSQTKTIPFHPIYPEVTKRKSPPLLAVERITDKSIVNDQTLKNAEIPIKDIQTEAKPEVEPEVPLSIPSPTEQEKPKTQIKATELSVVDGEISNDFLSQRQNKPAGEIITDIYDLSKTTLTEKKLERFAAIELIPDKTLRIILTGDLLFASGEAELTPEAKRSLLKLSNIITQTPYMINVVGHTDSVPMHSQAFPTNWELSVARASRVARFLIEDINISGRQIAVSGFSYFRPIMPNNNDKNRKINRRVEIILSKELPPAVANASTLN